MPGLLQVALYTPDGRYIKDPYDMERALAGSEYVLDQHETAQNDGIAVIITKTEAEADRLMAEEGDPETGRILLPSGYLMEVDTP